MSIERQLDRIIELLEERHHRERHPDRARKVEVFFGPLKERNEMDSGSTNVGAKGIRCTSVFTDDQGNSDPIYSVPTWSFDHPEFFTSVTPSPDGLTCDCAGPLTVGLVTGTISAEGDPTPGKNTLSEQFTIDIQAAIVPEDTKVNVTFSPLT